MKYFVIILSLFTMTMSALPCDDDVAVLNDRISQINVESPSDNHGLGDLCSPFCTCVCCASIVIQPTLTHESLISENLYSDLNTSYLFTYSSDYLNRIFQPPRV